MYMSTIIQQLILQVYVSTDVPIALHSRYDYNINSQLDSGMSSSSSGSSSSSSKITPTRRAASHTFLAGK